MKDYNCFGCCPHNPLGVRMRFFEEDEADKMGDIVSVWQPTQNHQSWINTLHGGIHAVLLDEVCGWVVFKKLNTSGVTAKFELRYKSAVSTINGPLILRARLKSDNHRIAVVEGELCDKDGNVHTRCECTYFYFPEQKAKEMQFLQATLANEDYTLEQVIELVSKPTYRRLK